MCNLSYCNSDNKKGGLTLSASEVVRIYLTCRISKPAHYAGLTIHSRQVFLKFLTFQKPELAKRYFIYLILCLLALFILYITS